MVNMTDRGERGLFRPGNRIAVGRPKGARNKLGEKFLEVLLADFAEHGVEVIEKLRVTNPAVYVKVLASILPRQLVGEDGGPLLTNITVVYRKPGEVAPEVAASTAATAIADAVDEATNDDHEDELPDAAD
jgi:hypothetical protein